MIRFAALPRLSVLNGGDVPNSKPTADVTSTCVSVLGLLGIEDGLGVSVFAETDVEVDENDALSL